MGYAADINLFIKKKVEDLYVQMVIHYKKPYPALSGNELECVEFKLLSRTDPVGNNITKAQYTSLIRLGVPEAPYEDIYKENI